MKRLKIENTVALGSSFVTIVVPKACCWSSAIAGFSGGTTYFSWVYPLRPYLFILAFLSLGYGFYKAYKPKVDSIGNCGNCQETKNFFKSKLYTWIVALFVLIMFIVNYSPNLFTYY